MTHINLRDAANSRFNLKTAAERRAAIDAEERETAAIAVRAKTERLKALRLAQESRVDQVSI